MTKEEAIRVFDSQAGLARAIGVSRSRISQWGDTLDQQQTDRIVGAAIRTGKFHLLPPKARSGQEVSRPNQSPSMIQWEESITLIDVLGVEAMSEMLWDLRYCSSPDQVMRVKRQLDIKLDSAFDLHLREAKCP